jgi:hypothetical protein
MNHIKKRYLFQEKLKEVNSEKLLSVGEEISKKDRNHEL